MTSQPELVHPIPVEEMLPWARAMAATFLHDPHAPAFDQQLQALDRLWMPERAWGVRDRGRWVATLRSEDRMLTVPGHEGTRELAVDAVTNVTVSPTQRRRGHMRSMVAASLRAAHDRGAAVSILIAAEWPIYGRFGYAPATLGAKYALRRSRSGSTVDGDVSSVRQVEREEFGEVAAAVYAAARRGRAGQVDRAESWWSRALGRDGYTPPSELPFNWLLHEGDDGPDGLLAWGPAGDQSLIPPLPSARVWTLAAAGDGAYRDLWAYLSGIDGVDEITLSERPIDEPVRWLLGDARTLVMTERVDFLWLRILDVAAALGARSYAVPGDVVLEVRDEQGGFAAGRCRLQAGEDGAQCAPTDAAADITITQPALASIYLGGFRLRELLLTGGATEHTPGVLARLDAMFATAPAPWNATWF
jgi:predicted acetyltransferase